MFALKRPCVSCPFRVGQGETFQLHPERLTEIFEAPAFQCHKTIDYDGPMNDEGFSDYLPGNNPQQCAGLMAVLAREGIPNQIMQVAVRLGELDLSTLDPRGEAYPGIPEARAAHSGKPTS